MADEHDRPSAGASTPTGDLDSTFELIDRARRSDQGALDRLFARHLKPLQRWATGRLPAWARGLTDTDDLVQDTLLRTFKRVETFEPRRVGALQAYLRQAVLNRLRDELREAVESYEQALRRLRPEEREAVIGRVELGMSYEELAVALGKPTADAARKAAQRALVPLAREIKPGG